MFIFGKKRNIFLNIMIIRVSKFDYFVLILQISYNYLKEYNITWVFVYEYYITIYRNNLLKLNSYLNSYLN